jgi:hypothetical protein
MTTQHRHARAAHIPSSASLLIALSHALGSPQGPLGRRAIAACRWTMTGFWIRGLTPSRCRREGIGRADTLLPVAARNSWSLPRCARASENHRLP